MGEFIPRKFKLNQNYPNPFNPSTFIEFDIPERAKVRLVVHDVLGREIKVLIDGELEPGRHRVMFDSGGLPTGVYFYRFSYNGFCEVRKMILII